MAALAAAAQRAIGNDSDMAQLGSQTVYAQQELIVDDDAAADAGADGNVDQVMVPLSGFVSAMVKGMRSPFSSA